MKYTLIFLIFLLIVYQIKVIIDNNLEPKELNLDNINLLEMKENNPILSCKNNNDIHFVEKENDMVSLDKIHSEFELSTYKNNFSYCRVFVDFILKENVNRKTIRIFNPF